MPFIVSILASSEDGQDREDRKDRAFLETLQSNYYLPGKGSYADFSLHYMIGRGKEVIRLAHATGSKPFLQQVMAEPTFVYWDLRAYPVSVFIDQYLHGNRFVDLSAPLFQASCMHASICR